MTTATLDRVLPAPRRVSPEEDGMLRRLHALEGLGVTLSTEMARLKAEIRSRDLRAEIREPDERVVVLSLTG